MKGSVPDDIQKIGERDVIKLRDQVLPLIHLDDALSLQTKAGNMAELVRARGSAFILSVPVLASALSDRCSSGTST